MTDLALEDEESLNAGLGDPETTDGDLGPRGSVSDPVNPDASTANDDESLHLQKLENSPMSDDQLERRLDELDTNEEITLISNSDAALEDLKYLRDDILKAGGMSQAFALEARRIDPKFDDKNPIGFYTQLPTATRYKASLESIGESMHNFLKKIWEWITKILGKIASYFTRGKVKLNEDGSNVEEVLAAGKEEIATQKKEYEKKRDDLEEFIKKVLHVDSELRTDKGYKLDVRGEAQTFKNLNEAVEFLLDKIESFKHVKDFLETRQPFLYDMLHNGPYQKAIFELIKNTPSYLSKINEKNNLIVSMLYEFLDAQHDEDDSETVIKNMRERLSRAGLSESDNPNEYAQVVDKISQIRTQVEQEQTEQKYHYTDLLRLYSKLFHSRPYEEVYGDLDLLHKSVVELTAKKNNLDKLVYDFKYGEDHLNQEYLNVVRDAVAILKKNIVGISMMILAIERYQADSGRIHEFVTHSASTVFVLIKRNIRDKDGNPVVD